MSAERLTVTEVARTLLERGHSDRRPSITLERSAAPGSKGLVKITVDVPVCDEFPTADDACMYAKETFEYLCNRFPMPDVNGGEKP
jgi:hypothetical protein